MRTAPISKDTKLRRGGGSLGVLLLTALTLAALCAGGCGGGESSDKGGALLEEAPGAQPPAGPEPVAVPAGVASTPPDSAPPAAPAATPHAEGTNLGATAPPPLADTPTTEVLGAKAETKAPKKRDLPSELELPASWHAPGEANVVLDRSSSISPGWAGWPDIEMRGAYDDVAYRLKNEPLKPDFWVLPGDRLDGPPAKLPDGLPVAAFPFRVGADSAVPTPLYQFIEMYWKGELDGVSGKSLVLITDLMDAPPEGADAGGGERLIRAKELGHLLAGFINGTTGQTMPRPEAVRIVEFVVPASEQLNEGQPIYAEARLFVLSVILRPRDEGLLKATLDALDDAGESRGWRRREFALDMLQSCIGRIEPDGSRAWARRSCGLFRVDGFQAKSSRGAPMALLKETESGCAYIQGGGLEGLKRRADENELPTFEVQVRGWLKPANWKAKTFQLGDSTQPFDSEAYGIRLEWNSGTLIAAGTQRFAGSGTLQVKDWSRMALTDTIDALPISVELGYRSEPIADSAYLDEVRETLLQRTPWLSTIRLPGAAPCQALHLAGQGQKTLSGLSALQCGTCGYDRLRADKP